jgi:hypothetical protein
MTMANLANERNSRSGWAFALYPFYISHSRVVTPDGLLASS